MVAVENSQTYEKGKPKVGGLSDLKMGTMDRRGATCATCGGGSQDCPGHFGSIELAKPMYHVWLLHDSGQGPALRELPQLSPPREQGTQCTNSSILDGPALCCRILAVQLLTCINGCRMRRQVAIPKFNAARKLRNPESRLRAFLDLCSGKKHDDSTGGPQPAYRTEAGMKITAEFPKEQRCR